LLAVEGSHHAAAPPVDHQLGFNGKEMMMKRTASFGTKTRLALAITMLAVLSACGGGGGDGGAPAPTLIDLTAANRDTVAHAAAGSLMALGVSTAVPVSGNAGGVARREFPMTVGATWAVAFGAARERPLAVIPTPPQSCAFGGTTTVSFNDANNNGTWDIGEAATVVFNHCKDTPSYEFDGTAVLTFTASSATSFSATMGMTQLAQQATNGRHAMTLNGNLALACSTQPGATWMRCTSTASGPVSAAIQTHLFNDTVTLHNGFVEDSTSDSATGHTLTTLHGTIDSAAAGGAVSVTTESAFGALDSDEYPHDGAVRVAGNRGTMRVTALSAAQVRLDLDDNNDGAIESTRTDTWDWLL
jgi:hypothetical protein